MNRIFMALLIAAAVSANAQDKPNVAASWPVCEAFGPQAPRDIDVRDGQNPQTYRLAPRYQEMNLCNIHFHNHAEHKAKDFAIHAGKGEHSHGGGYQCGISKALSAAELKAPDQDVCKGLKPGDTIEVHWVHSSCQVKPGVGLDACSSDKCANPELRVEAQVFTLVNDPAALKFGDFGYGGNVVGGRHQAKTIPTKTGEPVEFLGSTTGPKYTEQACSPMQVTWGVRPKCAKLDINSLAQWCKSNEFGEDHAHGVRELVVNPKLLSPIK